MNKILVDTCQLYVFETVERITRFYIHLEEIREQFYLDDDSRIKDKISFIKSYEECLEKKIKMLLEYSSYIDKNKETIEEEKLKSVFKDLVDISLTIVKLHIGWLNHLPRPSEPIELRRFCRVIEKQVFLLNQDEENIHGQISIYVNEQIGESTYASDPLQNFKSTEINPNINGFNRFASSNDIDCRIEEFSNGVEVTENSTIHITIPRIDANNPCHWPTLMHEVAHKVMRNDFFEKDDIEQDFLSSLNVNQKKEVELFKKEYNINLKSWLTECWSDLFACVSIGHSLWFSQYASFLSNSVHTLTNETHPPALFRINLIEKILTHRFSRRLFNSADHILILCENLLRLLDSNNAIPYEKNKVSTKLFLYFREYFLQHFFKFKDDKIEIGKAVLNEKLQPVVKYVNDIQLDNIKQLVDHLNSGLPIPSICIKKERKNYVEIPTSIQEIFLAAWLYRNAKFKKRVLANFLEVKKDLIAGFSFRDTFEEKIVKEFKRFDQSILRSIQVSEWIDVLMDKNTVESSETIINDTTEPPLKSIISDTEIEKLIINDKIKIIPIINFQKQLGSTSFDIRLGTSFQLFFPNQYGIIDFIDPETTRNAKNNSKKINLDFLKPITITPNQFILGHSMEYIKLPDEISADLEGRSSFARLGLEIHMTAGFVDPGFEGVLTFELFNAGPNPIKLYPGMRIGQLRFMPINSPEKSYAKRHSAKYKGLLEHHNSLQGKDYEVEKIREEIKKNSKK